MLKRGKFRFPTNSVGSESECREQWPIVSAASSERVCYVLTLDMQKDHTPGIERGGCWLQ